VNLGSLVRTSLSFTLCECGTFDEDQESDSDHEVTEARSHKEFAASIRPHPGAEPPSAALEQMRRVLKRDGRLIFIEHGRSADPGVRIWQDRLTPMWKHIGGGCHLNRKIDDLIQAAGFQITDQRNFYLPGPRPMTYTYQGMASVV